MSANKAISEMHSTLVKGTRLVVEEARPKESEGFFIFFFKLHILILFSIIQKEEARNDYLSEKLDLM